MSTRYEDNDGRDEEHALINSTDTKPKFVYSCWVLVVLFLVYVNNQMTRGVLGFIYGDKNKQFIADTNITPPEYGLLTGYGFSVIYVVAGVPLGLLADRWSRKWVVFGGVVVWSAATALSGLVTTFWQILLARLMLGLGQAACSPPALSMISDYFPPDKRATANAVYNFGIYLGGGLSSALGGGLIEPIGWRWTFVVFAITGGAFAVLLLLTVLEPRRGQYDKVKTDADDEPQEKYTVVQTAGYLLKLKSAVLVSLAAGIRSIAGYAFGAFMYKHLSATFALDTLSLWYGLITAAGGVTSAFLGGIITDKWVATNPKARAYVPAIGALTAIPFVCGVLLSDIIFGEASTSASVFALVCLLFAYITAECWGGPAASVLQMVLPPAMRTTGMSVYFFVMTLLGGSGPELVGALEEVTSLRYALLGTVCGGYFLCAMFFLATTLFLENDVEAKNSLLRSVIH